MGSSLIYCLSLHLWSEHKSHSWCKHRSGTQISALQPYDVPSWWQHLSLLGKHPSSFILLVPEISGEFFSCRDLSLPVDLD